MRAKLSVAIALLAGFVWGGSALHADRLVPDDDTSARPGDRNNDYDEVVGVKTNETDSPHNGNIRSHSTRAAINVDTSGEDIVLDCPGVFELRFDKSDGGNITEYYDLIHDASASVNIAAHMGSLYDGLYMILFKQENPEEWTANFRGAADSLEVVEVQWDKVKIRAQGDFVPRNGWTPPASYDIRYTVTSSAQIYIYSRVIFNQAYSNHMQIRQAHCLTTTYATSDGWVEFSQDQDLTPYYYQNGYDDDYIGARIDAADAKIDPVLIMYRDWDICDYVLLIAPPEANECLIAWVSNRNHSFAAGEVIEKKFLLAMDQFDINHPSGPASIAAQYRAGDGGDFFKSPPLIAEVTPDPDVVKPGTEYVEQLVLLQGSPVQTWSIEEAPAGAQVSGSGLVSGWTPEFGDLGSRVTFEIRATNESGSDTESWLVRVGYRADFDEDYDVDQEDLGHFQACMTGSGVPQTDPDCQDARLDGDADVDQNDFGVFEACMNGPNNLLGC